jgi:hypothetical protein
MPVAAPIEAQVLDAILAACSGIGTGGTWRSTPYSMLDGVPNDDMGALDRQRTFLQHVRSEPSTDVGDLSRHGWMLTFNVWVAATSMRGVLDTRRDVLVAIYAAEGTFQNSFRQFLMPGGFAFHDDLMKSGVWLGTQTFTLNVETDHATP